MREGQWCAYDRLVTADAYSDYAGMLVRVHDVAARASLRTCRHDPYHASNDEGKSFLLPKAIHTDASSYR